MAVCYCKCIIPQMFFLLRQHPFCAILYLWKSSIRHSKTISLVITLITK